MRRTARRQSWTLAAVARRGASWSRASRRARALSGPRAPCRDLFPTGRRQAKRAVGGSESRRARRSSTRRPCRLGETCYDLDRSKDAGGGAHQDRGVVLHRLRPRAASW